MTEISDETYEQLRQILEKQNRRAYTLEEAKEIGDGLVGFYTLLMELDNEETRPLGGDGADQLENETNTE